MRHEASHQECQKQLGTPKIGIEKAIKVLTNSGYQGIAKIHIKSALTKEEKKGNELIKRKSFK